MEAPWKRVCELLLYTLIVGKGLEGTQDQGLDRVGKGLVHQISWIQDRVAVQMY